MTIGRARFCHPENAEAILDMGRIPHNKRGGFQATLIQSPRVWMWDEQPMTKKGGYWARRVESPRGRRAKDWDDMKVRTAEQESGAASTARFVLPRSKRGAGLSNLRPLFPKGLKGPSITTRTVADQDDHED